MAATLDHIENTLADAYRKEIDQEDNVWRTLPFFAAIISFEMAAISQVLGRLPARGTGAWEDVIIAVFLIACSVLVALWFIALAIQPQRFVYVSNEPQLLAYARGLDQDEQQAVALSQTPVDALAELKSTLADQYAIATHHNRQINQRRAWCRSIAGLATVGSILLTVFLVARVLLHYIPNGT